MWSNCSEDEAADAGLGWRCCSCGGGGDDDEGRNPARELESLEEERRLDPRLRQLSLLSNLTTPESKLAVAMKNEAALLCKGYPIPSCLILCTVY